MCATNSCFSFSFIAGCAFVLQWLRAKAAPLFFGIQMPVIPPSWILINIFPTRFIIISVTNDMLCRRSLKHFFYPVFLLAAARSQGLKRTNHIVQGRGGACSSRLLMQEYYRVNMVWHNDVILYRNTGETGFHQL